MPWEITSNEHVLFGKNGEVYAESAESRIAHSLSTAMAEELAAITGCDLARAQALLNAAHGDVNVRMRMAVCADHCVAMAEINKHLLANRRIFTPPPSLPPACSLRACRMMFRHQHPRPPLWQDPRRRRLLQRLHLDRLNHSSHSQSRRQRPRSHRMICVTLISYPNTMQEPYCDVFKSEQRPRQR